GDAKAITTQSGIAYDGLTIPPTLSPLPKVVERETEATKDKVQATRLESCNALADLGASINLMHLSVWKKLCLSDLTSTRITLELATSTSKHPHKHGNESINMINFIDITCEDRLPKVLKFKKSNHPSSGSTTPLFDSSPSLTPFETSDSLLEEEIEFLMHQDPSTESNIETINPILEKFTNEPSLDYLPPPGDDDDDLFDLKSDNNEWKKLLYGYCYKDIDYEKDKNKDSKMKSLVIEAHIVKSNDLLP
nr:reverse transcriptase domain-containing protein [Tanacetum cinerariifolium]